MFLHSNLVCPYPFVYQGTLVFQNFSTYILIQL